MTCTLSVAVKLLTATASEVEVAGSTKAVTTGGITSVMVTVAERLADTLPMPSLAQA